MTDKLISMYGAYLANIQPSQPMMLFFRVLLALGLTNVFGKHGPLQSVGSFCGRLLIIAAGQQTDWSSAAFPIQANAHCVTKKMRTFSTFSLAVCLQDSFGILFCIVLDSLFSPHKQ